MDRQSLALEVLTRLQQRYPDAKYELTWSTPFELVIATILAAQATDARVNAVTATLFTRWPDPQAFVDADHAELEKALTPTGFYRRKAKAVRDASRTLLEKFGGVVPQTVDELTQLPDVARKTANVVLNTAFNLPSGIIVDTHVARVSRRLGLTDLEDPDEIEAELMPLIPQDQWTQVGPAAVLLGRYTCTSRVAKCEQCVMTDVCLKRIVKAGQSSAVEEDATE